MGHGRAPCAASDDSGPDHGDTRGAFFRLEREELNWLSWGRVDGALSHARPSGRRPPCFEASGDPIESPDR